MQLISIDSFRFAQPTAIDRRRFLWFTAALPTCAAFQPPSEAIHSVRSDERSIETSNLGLITAYRPEFSTAENQSRSRELWCDLTPRCGRLLVRGCSGRAIEVEAFLVFGKPDDSGNLKGLLRKLARKYGQDAVLHKPYYRDAQLYALKNLPDLGLRNRKEKNLGKFRPDLVGSYLTLITGRGANAFSNGDLPLRASSDLLSSPWHSITFWAYRGGLYPKQSLHRVIYGDTGIRDAPACMLSSA